MTRVNVDNYARAETATMFDNQLAMSGGVNQWIHFRVPTPVDQQPVIRMNRDTLYSGAIVDISGGGTVTLPDAGGRYLTLMVINEDRYINRVFSKPGTYKLSVADHTTPFVNVVARILVDANDPDDIAEVNRLQDQVILTSTRKSPTRIPTTTKTVSKPRRMPSSHSVKACPTPLLRSVGSQKSTRSGI